MQHALRSNRINRLCICLADCALGLGAALALLLAAGSSARPSHAAPDSLAYPGCADTIQECLDTAPAGETIVIQPGTYITSLTLSRAVSLTGVSSDTVILHALAGQRVLTVTGAAVDSTVVISGLTFTGGSAAAGDFSCPTGCGGGIYIGQSAQPRLLNSMVISNFADDRGGGLYADGSLGAAGHLELTSVQFISNTAVWWGGGAHVHRSVTAQALLFENNGCMSGSCIGGGLYVYGSLALAMTDTSFISNTSGAKGGGAFVDYGSVSISNSQFLRNRCVTSCQGAGLEVGGGLSSNAIPVTLSGTDFISNTNGGGAWVTGAVSVIGSLFQQNGGNGLSTAFGVGIVVTDSQFLGNAGHGASSGSATTLGGRFENNTEWGLFTCNFTMRDTVFAGNQAGGANACLVSLDGGLFEGNQSYGLVVVGGTITGTRFIANASSGLSQTGFIFVPNIRIVNALFAGNNTSNTGPALYLSPALAPSGSEILHTTFASPTLAAGPAIEVVSGTVGITNSIIASHTVGISLTGGTAFETHNLFFGNTTNLAGPVSSLGGSLTGDPHFADPAAGDYHLTAGSAALNLGLDAGVNTDADGEARPNQGGFDAGYDEYWGILFELFLPLVLR